MSEVSEIPANPVVNKDNGRREHLIAADLGPGSQGRDSNQALEKGTQGHTYAGLTDHAPAPFQGSPLARRPGDREDGYTSLLHVH